MRVVAVGSRSFATGFRLAGVEGKEVASPDEGLENITKLMKSPDIGLILISSDIAKPLRSQLTEMRKTHPTPLLYEVPAPGGAQEKIEYRDMLREILGV